MELSEFDKMIGDWIIIFCSIATIVILAITLYYYPKDKKKAREYQEKERIKKLLRNVRIPASIMNLFKNTSQN